MLARKLLPIALLALSALVLSATSTLGSMIPQSLDELTANSTHIVRGVTLSVEAKWDETGTTIFTEVTIRVNESFKATTALPEIITLTYPGGTVGDTRLWVEHTPEFEVGQEVVTFLVDKGPRFNVTSWVQGKYTVVNNKIAETGATSARFISQINEVVATENKRNREEK